MKSIINALSRQLAGTIIFSACKKSDSPAPAAYGGRVKSGIFTIQAATSAATNAYSYVYDNAGHFKKEINTNTSDSSFYVYSPDTITINNYRAGVQTSSAVLDLNDTGLVTGTTYPNSPGFVSASEYKTDGFITRLTIITPGSSSVNNYCYSASKTLDGIVYSNKSNNNSVNIYEQYLNGKNHIIGSAQYGQPGR